MLLYTYISRFSVNPLSAEEKKSDKASAINFISQPLFIPFFNFSHKWPTFAFTPKAGTHSAFREKSHTAAHRAKQGCFGWGRYLYPLTVLRGPETLRDQRVERHTLPLLGLGRGCSRRTQKAFGTAMRLCVSLSRGVAAPLGCVIFFAFVEIGICTSGAHDFPRVRGMGGITTLGVLCVLLKRRTAACQKGSFAVF